MKTPHEIPLSRTDKMLAAFHMIFYILRYGIDGAEKKITAELKREKKKAKILRGALKTLSKKHG